MSDRWVIGVDIGGTNVVVGVVPFVGGAPLTLRSAATRVTHGPDAVVEDVAVLAETVVSEARERHRDKRARVVGVGIGCPGPLDRASGRVITTPNLGWTDYPIRERIAERLGLPATVDNDANCATYGEWWQGAGRGVGWLAGLTLGTGIGGGMVVGGKLLRGVSGTAGEFGHTTVQLGGRPCACGNIGCLEAYASGLNIAARAREGIQAGRKSAITEMVKGDLARVTAATVFDALVLGDVHARDVVRETAEILGAGVANILNIFNPEVVVVVGGVTRAGEHLFAPLRAEVRRRAFGVAVDACRIVPGELGGAAGVVGAAGVFISEQDVPE